MTMQTITERTDTECYISSAPWIVEAIEAAVRKDGTCSLGIVGGRSIAAVLDKILPYAAELKGKIEVYWLDERLHAEKNYTAALPILEELAHHGVEILWHPILSTHKESVHAELQQVLDQIEKHKGKHTFDVLIVSAGEDGHICSLFPNFPQLHETVPGYVVVENAPKAPPVRVTVTPPLLLTAQHAFLYFIGEKKEAYTKFIKPDTTIDDCPAKMLEKIPHLSVFVCVR